ncbi:glycosyl hydrolase [Scheffersomyces coipomensis]|uniref:glycosyl hydrolase n=1 Tax=Scheffersomyces coipomensis TaxID=1788519 RepID=UPI00315D5C4A
MAVFPKIDKNSISGDKHYVAPKAFPIGPFTKYSKNPILRPDPNVEFESAYLYNATAIVIDELVFMLYRAQNPAKLSSVGLAFSSDGYNFTKYNKPIISATEPWEAGGGIEDPRIVRDPKTKLFIVTYTAYDLFRARLCVATSEDLFHWTKYRSFVPPWWNDIANDANGKQLIRNEWSKSGAVFTEKNKDGKYYMIWGDSSLYLAESEDLVQWKLTNDSYYGNIFATAVFNAENKLIEAGPAPIKLDNGKNEWILVYNAATIGGKDLAKDTYTISQMLIDYDHIRDGPLARLEKPILRPEQRNEVEGQVNKVVFCEGIVQFKGQWFLYYGQGDSELGVATAPVN